MGASYNGTLLLTCTQAIRVRFPMPPQKIDMYDLTNLKEKIEAISQQMKIEDEIYADGVVVRSGNFSVYMSHEGYDQFNKEVLKKLREEIKNEK